MDFSGNIFCFSVGYQLKYLPIKFYLDGNLGEVTTAKEFADHSLFSLHGDYEFAVTPKNFITVGGFAGYSEYELIIGPEVTPNSTARIFSDNPKASGYVYEASLGVRSLVGSGGFIDLRYDYALGSTQENDDVSTSGVKSLEITD